MISRNRVINSQKHFKRATTVNRSGYLNFVRDAHIIIMQLDMRGYITFLNEFALNYFGFSEEELVGQNALMTIIPEKNKNSRGFKSMVRNIVRLPDRYARIETETVLKDGGRRWILWANSVLRDKNRDVNGLLCIGHDVTERKLDEEILKECCGNLEKKLKAHTAQLRKTNEELHQEIIERKWAEDILRKSEEKYRLLVENANEAIVITQDGYFKYLNPKASRVMNYSADELILRPVDEFIHPEDRAMLEERRLKMYKGESIPNVFSCRIIDKGGVIRWMEVNSILITWMGRPAILSFFNNITERKRAEEELNLYQRQLRSLASELSLAEEKERRRIAVDLHDHIGQTLAFIKIKLGALQKELSSYGNSGQIDYIRSLTERAIDYTKSLTFQLSPPILYELGFKATIEWLGEQMENEHNILFEFEDDGNNGLLDLDVSVLMFQAVRELVINSIKHAQAHKVKISIQTDNGLMQVNVEDDGIGFDTSKIGNTTFGFFSIRERLTHFGGAFTIDSKPGRGTSVSLAAPVLTNTGEQGRKGV